MAWAVNVCIVTLVCFILNVSCVNCDTTLSLFRSLIDVSVINEISIAFDDFKTVPADQKKAMGQELNELKNTALAKINELKELLSNAEEDLSGIDLMMPGDPL